MVGSDFKQIQVFIAVVQSGGLTAAQVRLGMGCPAISKQLSDLEVRTGMRLCQRGRKGFQLTEEGRSFYQAALRLQDSWQLFKSEVKSMGCDAAPLLRIGTVDATLIDSNNPLPESIQQLKRDFSGLEIVIHLMKAEEIAQGVLNQSLDLGISYKQEYHSPLSSSLLYHEQLCFVCRSEVIRQAMNDTPDSDAAWATIAEQEGLISFKTDKELSSNNALIEQIKSIKQYSHCNNVEEILWQTLSSQKVGLVPGHVLAQYNIKSLGLSRFDIKDARSEIYAIYRSDNLHSAVLQALMSMIL